jgi:hypothetical protein
LHAQNVERALLSPVPVSRTRDSPSFESRFNQKEDEVTARHITHPEPAWREQGDMTLPVRLVFAGDTGGQDLELLWCRQTGDDRFVLCCIPFVLSGMALGDELIAEPEEDGHYRIRGVAQASHHVTFRAWFGQSAKPDASVEVRDELTALGCLTEEFSSAQVVAVSASFGEQAQSAERSLEARRQLGHLQFDKTHSVPEVNTKIHHHPVWRDRADAIVNARVEHAGTREIQESLWAKRLDDNRYEICCIPFFIHDLALGDEVKTALNEAGKLVLQSVVKRSGNETYWIWFNESDDREVWDKVYESVARSGCLVEGYNADLIAFNAASEEQAGLVLEALKEASDKGLLECVSGNTR